MGADAGTQPGARPRHAARGAASSAPPFIKRVIGVGGDLVVVRANGPTLVNGKPLVVKGAPPNPEAKAFARVPPGSLLVLGDNRANSCDSRQWVPSPWVPVDNVLGKAQVG